MSRVAARLVFAAILLAPFATARAQENAAVACGAPRQPWIALAGDAWPAAFDGVFRSRFIAQLGAGLAARHMGLCVAREGAQSAAGASSEVSVAATSDDAVTVAVRDAVTDKRIAREISLAAVPPDARPLTLALAVDELLRAGWLELALADAPAAARPVPPEIAALGRPTFGASSATPRPWEVGAALAAERFGGGTRLAGLDLVVRAGIARFLGLHVALGLRKAADVSAPDGVVRATVIGAALGAESELASPAPDRRWRLALGASGRLMHANLSGEPRDGAQGNEATATALYVCASLRGAVRVGRSLWVTLEPAFGVPVRAVDFFDGTTRVAGLSGPLMSLALGATWVLP